MSAFLTLGGIWNYPFTRFYTHTDKTNPNQGEHRFCSKVKRRSCFCNNSVWTIPFRGRKRIMGFLKNVPPSHPQLSMPTPQRMNASILDKMGGDIYFEIWNSFHHFWSTAINPPPCHNSKVSLKTWHQQYFTFRDPLPTRFVNRSSWVGGGCLWVTSGQHLLYCPFIKREREREQTGIVLTAKSGRNSLNIFVMCL